MWSKFGLSFREDAIGIRLRDVIGPDNMTWDNMMWGSDYPHSEATFPQSRKILAEILEGVPDDEQAKPAPDRDPGIAGGCGSPEPSVRVDCPAYCGKGRTRTRAGSTTRRLAVSLLTWMRKISATSSA